MRRFPAPPLPDAPGDTVELDASASHHLLRVTGIAPGEQVELYDSAGRSALASLQGTRAAHAVLTLDTPPVAPIPQPEIWLLQALLKQAPFDTVVRMATELGATHLLPVQAKRSIARGDRSDRWTRILTAATTQSGRSRSPTLHSARSLRDALAALPDGLELRIHLPGAQVRPAPAGPVALMIGPEGGWTDAEITCAIDAGALPTGLGAHVLRADTAAAAALARCAR